MTMKTLDIEEYLFRRHRDKLYLQSIQLDLTNVCNANCMFCLQGSHTCSDNELTFDEICKILKDATPIVQGEYDVPLLIPSNNDAT